MQYVIELIIGIINMSLDNSELETSKSDDMNLRQLTHTVSLSLVWSVTCPTALRGEEAINTVRLPIIIIMVS